MVGAVFAFAGAVAVGAGMFGGAASAQSNPTVTLTPSSGFQDQEIITVSVGPNTLFPPGQSIKIIECAMGASSDSQCDGNTINNDSILTASDGSFTYTKYQLFVLPNILLGEPAGNHPVCNATAQCELYVGLNQTDFTQPKLFSSLFTIAPMTTGTTTTSSTTTVAPTTTTTAGTTTTTTTNATTTTTAAATTTTTATTVAPTTTTTAAATTTTTAGTTTTTAGATTTSLAPTTSTTATTSTTLAPTTTTTAGTTTTTNGTTTTTTTAAGTTTTTSGPSIQLASTVAAGQALPISGSGFAANASLQIEIESTPTTIGTVTADATGAFQTSVTIPASTDPGTHTIIVGDASGADQAQATITVTAAGTTPTSATTSTTVASALGVTGADARRSAALALALIGVGLLLLAAGWPSDTEWLRRRFRRVG